MSWRLLEDGAGAGCWNMGVDEAPDAKEGDGQAAPAVGEKRDLTEAFGDQHFEEQATKLLHSVGIHPPPEWDTLNDDNDEWRAKFDQQTSEWMAYLGKASNSLAAAGARTLAPRPGPYT